MLKLAMYYEDELKKKFAETMFDEKYKFYNFSSYYDSFEVNKRDVGWNNYQFVSVVNNEIIGYMSASINQDGKYYSGLSIINFTNNKIGFGKDLSDFLSKLFEREDMSKICFNVAVGNPIEKSYDKITAKYGGRIVGVFKNHVRLFDGKMYDKKMYEIFRDDYLKHKMK